MQRLVQKIVFASPRCLIDPSSGAAGATWQMLELLSGCGFSCQAFGAVRMDFGEEVCVEQVLAELGLPYEVRDVTVGGRRARMLFTRKGRVPVTLFRNRFSRCGPTAEEAPAYAAAWGQFLHRNRPDVVVTYGGDPLAMLTIDLAKRRDIPVVFALKNFAYTTPETFMKVDYVFVPSEYARRRYWERLGLVCQVLPEVVDPARVVAKRGAGSGEQGGRSGEQGRSEPPSPPAPLPLAGEGSSDTAPLPLAGEGRHRYLTFVNPQPAKGVFVFARIAAEVARRRPEIPMVVVEGRARSTLLSDGNGPLTPGPSPAKGRGEEALTPGPSPAGGRGEVPLARLGVDLSHVRLFGMANTPDPRKFYALAKVLVMPSLCDESFGLVAAEAMTSGIPVIASNRGALPETVGEGGVVLDIPARYTPEARVAPSAAEVEPWVEAILRLWDDPDAYARQSAAALAWSARWRPEALRPVYESFFRHLHPQPGPPLALREVPSPPTALPQRGEASTGLA